MKYNVTAAQHDTVLSMHAALLAERKEFLERTKADGTKYRGELKGGAKYGIIAKIVTATGLSRCVVDAILSGFRNRPGSVQGNGSINKATIWKCPGCGRKYKQGVKCIACQIEQQSAEKFASNRQLLEKQIEDFTD